METKDTVRALSSVLNAVHKFDHKNTSELDSTVVFSGIKGEN